MTNPLGTFGPIVASILAVIITVAAVVSHIVPGLDSSPWLDGAALIVIGLVFGVQSTQNGGAATANAALQAALSAHARLDAEGVPTAPPVVPAAH